MRECIIYFDVNHEYTAKVQIKCDSIKLVDDRTVEADGFSMKFSGVIESIDVDGKEFWSKDE